MGGTSRQREQRLQGLRWEEAGGGRARRRRGVGVSGRGCLRAGRARVLLGPVRGWDLPLIPKGSLWRTWARWQHDPVLFGDGDAHRRVANGLDVGEWEVRRPAERLLHN